MRVPNFVFVYEFTNVCKRVKDNKSSNKLLVHTVIVFVYRI